MKTPIYNKQAKVMSRLRLNIRHPDMFIIGKYGLDWHKHPSRPFVVIPIKKSWMNGHGSTIVCPVVGITLLKNKNNLFVKVSDGTLDVFSITQIVLVQTGGVVAPEFFVTMKKDDTYYNIQQDVQLQWNAGAGMWVVDNPQDYAMYYNNTMQQPSMMSELGNAVVQGVGFGVGEAIGADVTDAIIDDVEGDDGGDD